MQQKHQRVCKGANSNKINEILKKLEKEDCGFCSDILCIIRSISFMKLASLRPIHRQDYFVRVGCGFQVS